MASQAPFLIKDVHQLRTHFLSSAGQDQQEMRLWQLIRNCARTAPKQFPWFTPFVALVTQDAQAIKHAKAVLQDYIDKLEPMSFASGLQYHFWCFAFPHAKWSMYFQWLMTMDAYSADEAASIREKLIVYQFTNFFYGMRTKPEPECIDNQTLSLVLSNVMVGYLFSRDGQSSAMAEAMLQEGLRRLPGIIGGIPASGYTGEGSSYMDCVIAPAIPLIVELLQLISGETNLYHAPFAPNQVSPRTILEMAARAWLPGGLLLPWDNYGYQYGVRAPIAYAASHTKEERYMHLLQHEAVWSYDIGVGWAYDDLVWTCIWWPSERGSASALTHWMHPELGGVLHASSHPLTLIQMWDESEPRIPTRLHVNPNAVLFHAYGVPLSMDGSVRSDITRFQFADTWRETVHAVGEVTRYNYGDGCAGAHSVLLVDGWEGLRAIQSYQQFQALEVDAIGGAMTTDVTPLYQEHYADVQVVKRRSSLAQDRFFIIEDVAIFHEPHQFTSRFILRPDVVECGQGLKIRTQEGISLQIIDLLGQTSIAHERLSGPVYLYHLDRDVEIVDFLGSSGHRLFVAWISRSSQPTEQLRDWHAIWDESDELSYDQALELLNASPYRVALELPSYMEQALPIVKRWWYAKRIEKPRGLCWLQLPRGMHEAACWINGESIDFYSPEWAVLAPVIQVPPQWEQAEIIDVVIRTDVPMSHFDGKGEGTVGFNGGCYLCVPCAEEVIVDAYYEDEQITIKTNLEHYHWPYRLMEV